MCRLEWRFGVFEVRARARVSLGRRDVQDCRREWTFGVFEVRARARVSLERGDVRMCRLYWTFGVFEVREDGPRRRRRVPRLDVGSHSLRERSNARPPIAHWTALFAVQRHARASSVVNVRLEVYAIHRFVSPRGFAHVDIRPRWGQETSLPPSRAVRERVAETLKLTIERGAVRHASGARGRRRVR